MDKARRARARPRPRPGRHRRAAGAALSRQPRRDRHRHRRRTTSPSSSAWSARSQRSRRRARRSAAASPRPASQVEIGDEAAAYRSALTAHGRRPLRRRGPRLRRPPRYRRGSMFSPRHDRRCRDGLGARAAHRRPRGGALRQQERRRRSTPIVDAARAEGRRLLLTRLSPQRLRRTALRASGRSSTMTRCRAPRSSVARTPAAADGVGIVAAGTSDLPVAREAARTLAFNGYRRADHRRCRRRRPLAAPRPDRGDPPAQGGHRRRRHGGRAVQRPRRPGRGAGDRGADLGRLRRRRGRHGRRSTPRWRAARRASSSSTSTTASAPPPPRSRC